MRTDAILRRPSSATWVDAATRAAVSLGADPVAVMAGSRRKPAVRARWAAWKELVNAQQYSIAQIGAVSGFHHTAVLNALRPKIYRARRSPMSLDHSQIFFLKQHLGVDMTATECAKYLGCRRDDVLTAARAAKMRLNSSWRITALYTPRRPGDRKIGDGIELAKYP